MDWIASQITSLPVVCSIVYSGVNQRKHQSSASLAFVREIHRGPVNFPHKWPVTRKMFPFDDVIMFAVAYCIIVPDPIFRMALFCEISCWNNISDYYTVLNPYNLICWQLTTLHYTGVFFWMAMFHLVFNKNDYRYHSNATNYWNLTISCVISLTP